MNKSKASKIAKEYLIEYVRYCLTDCSDSYSESNSLESKFNGCVNDTIDIEDYIIQNLRSEYIKTVRDMYFQNNLEISDLEDPPTSLPIPYSEIKSELDPLLNCPF